MNLPIHLLKNIDPFDLDLTLKSQGSLLDFTKHNGYGNLTINGPGLGKIHLKDLFKST